MTIGKGDFSHGAQDVIRNFGNYWRIVIDVSDEGELLFRSPEHYEGDTDTFCDGKCHNNNIKNTESSITNYLINITLTEGNDRLAGKLENDYCEKDYCNINEYLKGSEAYYCHSDYVPQIYDCPFQINNTKKISHTLHGKGGDAPNGGKGGILINIFVV